LFLVSLPEAFLSLILFLLFAGEKEKLKFNVSNIIRFIGSLVLMLLASEFIRPKAPNVIVNMALHLLAYIIIILVVYRIKLSYAILSVGFAMLIYATAENAYVPYIVAYVYKGMDNFATGYLMYPVYSLPIRIAQLIAIWFFWKHETLLVTRINKRFHKDFIVSTLMLLLVEYFFLFLFYTYYEIMPLAHQIAFSIALCTMSIMFNLLVFRLVYNAVYGIVNSGYKHYLEFEEDVKNVLNEIQTLLKENKAYEAIKLINELNDKDINNKENGGEKE
jgi:hypothetical protein